MNTTLTQTAPSQSSSSQDLPWSTLCVVTTTVGHSAEAEDMARALVAAKVAACVQTERVTSYYEWDGVLQTSAEWRLVCKTLPEVLPRLTQLIREQHSYEVPQITMRTERCLGDYAQWLKQQVQA